MQNYPTHSSHDMFDPASSQESWNRYYQEDIPLDNATGASRYGGPGYDPSYNSSYESPPTVPAKDVPPKDVPPKDYDYDYYYKSAGVGGPAAMSRVNSISQPLNMERDWGNSRIYDEEQSPGTSRHHHHRSHKNGNVPTQKPRGFAERIKRYDWKKAPYLVWLLSVIQVCVFIAELAKMSELTGSGFATQPSFNPMLGPSVYVMINMGARFIPCMHYVANRTDATDVVWPCPNSTTTATDVCSLSELCGMGGVPSPTSGINPHQWWRFITPIFLHAGFIHIGFNLLLQLTLGSEILQAIGHVRFFIIYFAAGISGFILGGNLSPDGQVSTGCSGALFGLIALDLLDLLFNWELYNKPWQNLFFRIVEILISFFIGLLPGLDNFSHIGGFVMGILLGIAMLRSPLKVSSDSNRRQKMEMAYINWKNPKEQFTSQSPFWYVWVVFRAVTLVVAIVYFVELIKLFENGGADCSWCKYLSCLPVNGWCSEGYL